jgi:hypothetical protein
MNETRLTPEQARERFGELTVPTGSTRVHAHFGGRTARKAARVRSAKPHALR